MALPALREAALRFEAMFDTSAKPPLVAYDTTVAAARQASCPGEFGMPWVRVWDSTTYQAKKAEASRRLDSMVAVSRTFRPQLSDEQIRDSLALDNADYLGSYNDNVYILMHELGHLWFIHAFSGLTISYGTGGPGWLMETAAMLMEDARLSRRRHRGLLQLYRRDRAGKQPKLRPLDSLLTMPHDGGAAYYSQVRGVIDFLLERTQDSTIFGEIARYNPGRADLAGWLQAHGADYGLPTTVDALEREWLAWLARRDATDFGYGPP